MSDRVQGRTMAVRAAGVTALLTLVLMAGAAQTEQQSATQALPEAGSKPAMASPLSPRQKQLSDESAQLLALAVGLKGEVDKTNKDMLSLNVIRRADEIEKLAHRMRDHLRTVSAGK